MENDASSSWISFLSQGGVALVGFFEVMDSTLGMESGVGEYIPGPGSVSSALHRIDICPGAGKNKHAKEIEGGTA
jgi:hypothetical protein